MNYTHTLKFLYSQLPMYSRIGAAAYKEDIGNTLLLCELLEHPETKFKSIHVAGTNGKGSTSHMLAAIFQEHGFKTGLYTSPHLKDFRERIKINGVMISENEVTDFVEKYKDEVINIGCSFFEWTVGLAFDHFAKNKVDIAIIETGMGGRLDSTNVITPLLSVITNISFDHAEILGDTLEKIAAEKAGIIKNQVPVVIGERNDETDSIFISKATAVDVAFSFAEEVWNIIEIKNENGFQKFSIRDDQSEEWELKIDLAGEYQLKNIITVLESCRILNLLNWKLSKEKITTALSKVKPLTGLQGRWDVLNQSPLVIADVAHNEAGIKYAMAQLMKTDSFNKHLVIGFVKEKDLSKIFPLLPANAFYYFCAPDIPRA
ncbi:MAG: bifunctional folylpolyglutamate synthase/dihydrofolate synthase, partial [Chitinophagales bacterium]|nr:bifunctional folylpolyglutamate synthase/dihydrofolate synthase [Chitinophagales bacterium]